jgi:hypothetical protein
VFVTEEILKPYEEFATQLNYGSLQKTFQKPSGVSEIVHLVLCETYYAAVKKKHHRVLRRSLRECAESRGWYNVRRLLQTESDKKASALPAVISWTTNSTIFARFFCPES